MVAGCQWEAATQQLVAVAAVVMVVARGTPAAMVRLGVGLVPKGWEVVRVVEWEGELAPMRAVGVGPQPRATAGGGSKPERWLEVIRCM